MANKILVPLDGSELAAQALPYAAALAKKTGAELVLLSAIIPIETWLEAGGVFESDRRRAEEADVATAYLKFAKYSMEQEGLSARTIVAFGRAADNIKRFADEEDAALIAMTTHGRSGLPRLVLGSVAGEVIRTATRPVLLVRALEKPAAEVDIKRILVPVDGSALSESVLPVVEELAGQLGAELILNQVITPPIVLYPGEVVPSALPALDDIEAAAKGYVDELSGRLRANGFTVSTEVSVGYAAESILAVAAQHKADLIAMSSHGRTGIGRWVMGSVADDVVRRSTLPCLVIRPPAIVKQQTPAGEAPAVVEVVSGIAAAKTIVPPPAMIETQAETLPDPHIPPARPHRPERRALS